MNREPLRRALQSPVPSATISAASKLGPPPSRRPVQLFLRWGLPAVMLIVLGYFVVEELSPAELGHILERSEPAWILLGVGIYALTNLLRAARMVQLVGWPRSRTGSMLPIMFVLSLFNNLLPMRSGELSFPYMMQRESVPYGSSLAALVVSRLLDLLAVCVLFVSAAVFQYSSVAPSARVLISGAAAMVVLLLALLACLPTVGPCAIRALSARLGSSDQSAGNWRTATSVQLHKAATALRTLGKRGTYWPVLLLSLAIWWCTYAWFASFLRGIGLPTGMGRTILGASLAALAKALPIGTVGGFGPHEAGWTLGFVLLGDRVETAILGGLSVNLLTLLSSALFGIASLLWLARRGKRSWRHSIPWAPVLQRWQARLRRHWILVLILTAFAGLGSQYSAAVPLFETPDEVWHYLYVKHIADGAGLPVYREGVSFPMQQEASQPPLYYLLNGWATSAIDTSDADYIIRYNPHAAMGTPMAWGNRNVISHTPRESFPYRGTVLAAHASRLLSVLLGAGTLACTYAIARRLVPDPRWLAPAATAFNAFLPQFVFIHASTNNDVLVTLLAALCLWLLVCIAQEGASVARLLALGGVIGLAALSKLNGLVLLPLAAIVLAALAQRLRRSSLVLGWSAITFGVAGLVGGWWYLRNWMLYGDPFGLKLMFAVLPQRTQRPTLPELIKLMDGATKSFFGVFGWFNIVMDTWLYQAFLAFLILAVAGLARIAYNRYRGKGWSELQRLALLFFWSLAFVAALVTWTQARYPQGRLLFPALPAMAILLVLGVAQWAPSKHRGCVSAGLGLSLFVITVVAPFRYIAPAYAPLRPLTELQRAAIAHPTSTMLGKEVMLVGYDVSEGYVTPGQRLWLTLYWEGQAQMYRDYSVFVHLVDEHGVTVAQRDSFPGAGNNPTRMWTPGQVLADVYPLDVPTGLLSQGPFRLHVGMYDYASEERLVVSPVEGTPRDFVELPVALSLGRPSSTSMIELDLDFQGVMGLIGYTVEPIAARPGETLRIMLLWQARQRSRDDYTVFAQLLRQGDQIWGQNDHLLSDGRTPTSDWQSGQTVADEFELTVPIDAPDDAYDLTIGLYTPATLVRLKLADGSDFVVLGRIAVRRE